MTAAGAEWRNWGRTEKVRPVRVERPTEVGAVQRAVRAAAGRGIPVKAVGAGHSFSGAALAPGVQLDLTELSGLVGVDASTRQATFLAGTRLGRAGALLAARGLAMENISDIDRQTLAGAVSTGTHGTGDRFRGLASQVVGVRMVTGDGELVTIDAAHEPELLPAIRVGLGAHGILVEITVRCVPAFAVRAETRGEPFDAVVDGCLDRSAAADHFGFGWLAGTETAVTTTGTRLPADQGAAARVRRRRSMDLGAPARGIRLGARLLGAVAPAVLGPADRAAARLARDRAIVGPSAVVLAGRAGMRFRAMEYALPRTALPDALRELAALVRHAGERGSLAVEVRFAAADDDLLSTAFGRESGYIAVRRSGRDRGPSASELERVMLAHDGRPHWGMVHSRDAEWFRTAYPRFRDVLALRDRFDPDRVFRNPYLTRVLGP